MTSIKKFSELGVVVSDGDRKIFDCQQVSISDIINCEIVILDYIREVKTRHGEDRYLIMYQVNNTTGKFFTNSQNIKNTLDAINKEDYPFITTIRCTKCGTTTLYKLT